MRSIEILLQEHRWIEQMLACMERVVCTSRESGRLDPEVSSLLALFQYFADGLHQRKEEDVLFTLLLDRVGVPEKIEIARLLGQHEHERRLMGTMRSNLLGGIFGDAQRLRDFDHHAGAYVDLHRRHMTDEDGLLLPLAARHLGEEEDRFVCERFARVERDAGFATSGVHERIEGLAARLGLGAGDRRWGIAIGLAGAQGRTGRT